MNLEFSQYIGRKVLVKKSGHTIQIGGKNYFVPEYDVDPADTTISELQVKIGPFRLWLPGTMGTMDYRTDRLNVHVEEKFDGTFEVTRIYHG